MTVSAQLFGGVLIVLYLTVLIRMVRRGQLRAKYSFLWLSLGGLALVLVAIPGLLENLSGFVGIYYPPTLLFVMAIMLLMFVALHFSWELSRLEDRMRSIAEQLALLSADTQAGNAADEAGPE